MKLNELPDEMIITVMSFCSRNPRDLIRLSHTCRRFEKLISNEPLNSSSGNNSSSILNTFEMIKIETSEYLRKGHLFEKLIKRPFRTFYELVKEYLSSDKEIKSDEIKSEECRLELSSKKKLLNAFYFAKMDSKFHSFDKKVQDAIANVAKSDPTLVFGMIFTLMSIASQVFIGQYSTNHTNSSNPKHMNEVFWWIPYIFGITQSLLGGIWCAFTSYSLFRGFGILRKLNIHRFTTKFHKDANLFVSNLAIPIFAGLILIFNGYGMYSIKSFLYSILGMETSYAQGMVNNVNYYLSFPIWIYLGIIFISEVRKTCQMMGPPTVIAQTLLSNYILSLFLSLSIYKLGGGYLSFLPMSVPILVDGWCSDMSQYIKEKRTTGLFGFSRFALGISLAILGCGHVSYLTLAPVTLTTAFETFCVYLRRRQNEKEIFISPVDQ